MKKTFFYLLFIIIALVSSPQKSFSTQPIDFQTVVASDGIYRVVVDIDGNVWHWASSNHHQDPSNEFVYTNKNLPTKPQKIETISNVVSVSLSDGTAIAVTGDGLCFKWKYYYRYDESLIFVYNKEPEQIKSVENVKYAHVSSVYFGIDDDKPKIIVRRGSKQEVHVHTAPIRCTGLFVVHKDGTAVFKNSEGEGKQYFIKLPNNDKIKYITEFVILSESGKVYKVGVTDAKSVELNVELFAENCLFVQFLPYGGSVFHKDGKQSRFYYEYTNIISVSIDGEFKTNIKFWDNSDLPRYIRYDGVLVDCFGKPVNTDIKNLIYLSGDLYLRADGALFESTGGKYKKTSINKNYNITLWRLFNDKIHRIENIKIYTTHLIENLPSKIKIDIDSINYKNNYLKARYYMQ